jgi:hypothetical protein
MLLACMSAGRVIGLRKCERGDCVIARARGWPAWVRGYKGAGAHDPAFARVRVPAYVRGRSIMGVSAHEMGSQDDGGETCLLLALCILLHILQLPQAASNLPKTSSVTCIRVLVALAVAGVRANAKYRWDWRMRGTLTSTKEHSRYVVGAG